MKKIIGVALLVGAFLNAVALNETPLGPESAVPNCAELRVFSVEVDCHCIYVIIQGPMIKFDNFDSKNNLNLPFRRYQNLICNPINIRSNMTNKEVIEALEYAFNKQPRCKVKHLPPGNYPEDWNHKIGRLIAENEASQSYLEPSKVI